MRKSDLRTGMVVETRNGRYGIVLLNTASGNMIKWFWSDNRETVHEISDLCKYVDKLNFVYTKGEIGLEYSIVRIRELDIVRIYQPDKYTLYTTTSVVNPENIIWEAELVWKDVADILGHPFASKEPLEITTAIEILSNVAEITIEEARQQLYAKMLNWESSLEWE